MEVSDVYVEDKYVMMLGPLHIEKAGLKMFGDLLDGPGWTNAIAQAEITTKGTGGSFIHASHVLARTRRAHQVTASSLYILQRQAHESDKESTDREVPVSEESFIIIIIIMAGMAVFNVAGYLIEERRRWPVITASPRGQYSK